MLKLEGEFSIFRTGSKGTANPQRGRCTSSFLVKKAGIGKRDHFPFFCDSSKPPSHLMLWLLVLFLFVIVLFSIISWYQYTILYHPTREMNPCPTLLYSDLMISTDETAEIQGYYRDSSADTHRGVEKEGTLHENGVDVKKDSAANLNQADSKQKVIRRERKRGIAESQDAVPKSSYFRLSPATIYINAWWFNNHPGAKTVLFCHGNSGNISHRDYVIEICDKFGLNLFLFDYQGFGRSDGYPSTTKILNDGAAAYNFMRNFLEIPPEQIIVWGESLGGAVATHVASIYPNEHSRLLLMATFSSLDDVIFYKDLPGWLSRPMGLLARYVLSDIPSKDKITKVTCPVA